MKRQEMNVLFEAIKENEIVLLLGKESSYEAIIDSIEFKDKNLSSEIEDITVEFTCIDKQDSKFEDMPLTITWENPVVSRVDGRLVCRPRQKE